MVVDRQSLEQITNALHSACNALEHIQCDTTAGNTDIPCTLRTVREAILLADALCLLA